MMKKVSLIIITGFLGGCSLLDKDEPLPLYTLNSNVSPTSLVLRIPLSIDLPTSEASLNTERIAVTPSRFQRDYLANGQWPERLPKVFQGVLLESLSQRWGGAHVSRVKDGFQADFMLQSEIQDFSVYHVDKGCAEVHIKVLFKLIDFKARRILSSHTFTVKTPVAPPSMIGIVTAFNTGIQVLLEEALPWMEDVFLKEKSISKKKHS
jgi:cholesterol transport system auxiliary component